jgi:electron transfer flavoprotein alpha subunit
MSIGLVYLQGTTTGERVSKASLCAVTAALALQSAYGITSLVGVCIGDKAQERAINSLNLGLSEVLYTTDTYLDGLESVRCTHAIKHILDELKSVSLFICAATTHGKDIAPRIAVALEAGQASDIIAINNDGTMQRPMYAGDVVATVKIESARKVVTVRASAFSPFTLASGSGITTPLRMVTISNYPLYCGEVLRRAVAAVGRPELGDAEVVVSGGRALQSAEGFEKVIFPLADVLGAAIGASRAAVDAGYAPNDWQVGQTGKVVAPKLYIAVGISGAIQHSAGMKGSKVVVAINKDADAPIFEIADFGLVMDLYQAVPELTIALANVKMERESNG